jgi:hypothetical protein
LIPTCWCTLPISRAASGTNVRPTLLSAQCAGKIAPRHFSHSEFFNVVTRKAGVDRAAAAELVGHWSAAMAVENATLQDLAHAMRAVGEHGLSFWDALLWATVRRAGVGLLISEDFQDGRTIEGVRVINPFAPGNTALIDRTLAD